MKNKLVLFCLILFSYTFSQKFNVAFYNVENLFDTIDDPHKNDNEFLPSSKYYWNSERYFEKINRINQVFDNIGSILIAGFCEIENRAVLEDVVKSSKERNHFKIVHYDSEDARGIDVGLMYDSKKITKLNSGFIRFILPDKNKASTRDIVWAKFLVKKDTLFVLVNHWPSRMGGEEKSNPYRVEAAKNARMFIDSVQQVSPQSKMIFMGDLNDYPTNEAPKLIAEKLIPMITKTSGEFGGTYFYNKNWDILDHLLVSQNLLTKKRLRTNINAGKIHSPSFLIEEHKGDKKPFRTYASSKYLGGYSDHLPVSIGVKF
jgi:predicted extracellular nuclease